jgi:hypothetical protein
MKAISFLMITMKAGNCSESKQLKVL